MAAVLIVRFTDDVTHIELAAVHARGQINDPAQSKRNRKQRSKNLPARTLDLFRQLDLALASEQGDRADVMQVLLHRSQAGIRSFLLGFLLVDKFIATLDLAGGFGVLVLNLGHSQVLIFKIFAEVSLGIKWRKHCILLDFARVSHTTSNV